MPNPPPLPKCDVLIISWRDELQLEPDEEPVDIVWESLRATFSIPARFETYDRGYNAVLGDLWCHKLRQEERDQFFLLHPRLTGGFGRFRSTEVGQQKILLFNSDLRLNTDGPTMPALRMLQAMVSESQPRLVISVGLGGGVTAEQRTADVVVTGQSRFMLRGDLESSEFNSRTFGGIWKPDQAWFDDLQFDPLQDPPLQPPSPNYNTPVPLPRPEVHQPTIRISEKPVLTSPRLTETTFTLATPDENDNRFYLGNEGAVVEMDAAAVGVVCGDSVACGFVVGIVTPAIFRFDGQDFQQSLRNAWAEHFTKQSARNAAINAAQTVKRICEAYS